MTDVEAKTPTKRSISNNGGKKGFAKKAKLSGVIEKQVTTFNKGNNVQKNLKLKKKNKKNESENGSPKKLKPFSGTSQISSINKQDKQENKGNKNQEKRSEEQKTKKPRRNMYNVLKEKIAAGEKEPVLKDLEEKIKAIEERPVISKTGRRKLRLLLKLKGIAEGKPVQVGPQNTSNKLKEKKLQKQKAVTVAKSSVTDTTKRNVTVNVKSGKIKVNEQNKKGITDKSVTKKGKPVTKIIEEDEDSDDDINEENESDENDESSEVEEEAEGESEEDSDEDEGEGEGEGEEESGEEEESEEDESEEDSPPPQVSNKKQKKK